MVALGTFYDFYKIAANYKINSLLNTRILIVENQVETLINDDEKERLIEVYQNESILKPELFVTIKLIFKSLQENRLFLNGYKAFQHTQTQ